ncbi:MAG: hypothetical protein QM743_09200 [Chitinophagaceae bacterium]
MRRLDMAQDVQAAAVRHVDVEDHQVKALVAQGIHDLLPGGGLANATDLGVTLQELTQTRPYHGVIVGDEHSMHAAILREWRPPCATGGHERPRRNAPTPPR